MELRWKHASSLLAAILLGAGVGTAFAADYPAAAKYWESLAAQMTTPNRPIEYFRLLNGLDENEPLIPGERYKIVTE